MSDATVHLFTDIEGSTRLWEQEPERMRAALAAHDALGRTLVAHHGGRLVKTTGDGLHAVFTAPGAALAAAAALQQALATPDTTAGLMLPVRCGLHAGADEARDNDFYGRHVNRAARVMAAAHGGQVLLSGPLAEALGPPPWPGLPPGAGLKPLGVVRLRDLSEPEALHQLVLPALRADFPPPRGLAEVPHNLPQALNRFIGREAALSELSGLLGAHRLVTLWGPGGMGKSRLSVELAHRLREGFPDGVWLAELAPLADPDAVAPAVAAVLGVKEAPGQTLAQALALHVANRRLLLLLDNCEHVHAAAARLAKDLLRAGAGLCILATSRELLHVAGERAYALPPLAVPAAELLDGLKAPNGPTTPAEPEAAAAGHAAVQLFLDRARLVRPDFLLTDANTPVVGEICRRLDGIPLAIELAAARLRALSLDAMAERLRASFRLVATPDATVPPRQRTLQVLIDWSWDLLEAPERTLLARLSVFAGSCTLEAVEAVCADETLPADEVIDRLAQLVDKSLLALDGDSGRYRLLETVRAYAAEKLPADDRPALRQRLRAWAVATAQAAAARLAEPGPDGGLARLDLERPNLAEAHALALAERAGPGAEAAADHAYALAAAQRNYCLHRGLLTTGLQLVQGALAHPAGQGRDMRRARALFNLGQLCHLLGRHADARDALLDCQAVIRALGREADEAAVLQPLGLAHAALGDLEAARGCYETALLLARRHGRDDQQLSTLVCLAQWHQGLGDWLAAEVLYREAERLAQARGDRGVANERAVVQLNLGMVLLRQGQALAAADSARAALAEGLAHASASLQLGMLDLGAALAAERDERPLALTLAAAAQRLCEATGLRRERGDERFLDPWRERLADWRAGQPPPGPEADPGPALAALDHWLGPLDGPGSAPSTVH